MKLLIIVYFLLMSLCISEDGNKPFIKITHYGKITESPHFEQAVSELKSAKLLTVQHVVYETLQDFMGINKVDMDFDDSWTVHDITEIKFDSTKIPFHYISDFNDSIESIYSRERTACIILTHGNMKEYKDILGGEEDQYPFTVIKTTSRILRRKKVKVELYVILEDQLEFLDIDGWNSRYRAKIRLSISLNKKHYETLSLRIKAENSNRKKERETEIEEEPIYDNTINMDNMDKERKTESEDSGNVTNKVKDSKISPYAVLVFDSTDSSGNNKFKVVHGSEDRTIYADIDIKRVGKSLVELDNSLN